MLKIGVLGAGHLGKIHLKLLKDIAGFEVIGFFDTSSEVSQAVESELNIKAFRSYDELMEHADAIDVVTPTLHHYESASRAIKRSKHVFIEKPLTNTLEEAKSLLSLSKEADVKVQVGHVERYNPAFIAARPYCAQPMFIESHRLAQFNQRGTDVSVVLDLMIHDIDIVLSLVRSSIKRISASGVAVVSDTPDIANARIEFDNGCVANLTSSRISMKNMRKTRFFQRDAYISVDFLEKQVNITRLRNEEKPDDPFAITLDLGEDKKKKQLYFESPVVAPLNAIKRELEDFYSAIVNDTEPPVNIDDGYKAMDVAFKIIEKMNLNAGFPQVKTINP
ncbi:MAG TPA: Gfo/Idh/MocA family oxidoreductase [Bacteroidia bacterium]|jgi:predicted dehydrogenase|nr:Gfo/Idh/MocA family oxidoreductase [Bacteroidia bacterium]